MRDDHPLRWWMVHLLSRRAPLVFGRALGADHCEMEVAMKAGTQVRLPDGRVGTVVYHQLDGCGIVWGRHRVDGCGIVWGRHRVDQDHLPEPKAMLRDPYPSAHLPCVGGDYEVIPDPEGGQG